ncbi:Rho GTPase [Aspergillus pseudonomiae]
MAQQQNDNVMRRVDGRSVQLALWDTAGQEDYERLRPLAYSKAHVILIGFSVDTPDSLENVKHKWIEEANERCPGVPIILVGLKKDLREDPLAIEEMRKKSLKFVTSKEGSDISTQIGARKYLECSSLTGEGVDDVFEAATRAALLTFDKPVNLQYMSLTTLDSQNYFPTRPVDQILDRA